MASRMHGGTGSVLAIMRLEGNRLVTIAPRSRALKDAEADVSDQAFCSSCHRVRPSWFEARPLRVQCVAMEVDARPSASP